MVRDALRWMGEEVLAHMGPRRFVGELGLLNGQGAFLSTRATQDSRIRRVTRTDLRRLMSEDDELSDIVLHALWARREALRKGPAAMTLKFVGSTNSSDMLALRRFAERLDLVHKAVEFDPSQAASHPRARLHGRGPADRLHPGRADPARDAGHRRRAAGPELPGAGRRGRRPRRGGRRTGRARRRDLRRLRGPEHRPAGCGRPRRAGRGDIAHRELPGLPVRRHRRRPHRAGLAAGAQVRRARVRPVRSRRARAVRRSSSASRSPTAASSARAPPS